MDDLISRQAVIDINESYHGWMPDKVNYRIWKEIKELPAVNRWIPCKKRLPDKYGFYLVTLNNATTDFCLWNAMEFGWESSGIFNKCDEVTAWMPLPEPYKGEEE